MIITNNKGQKVDCSLEIVKERMGHHVTWSDVREPTEAEVKEIKSKPCDHKNQKMHLICDDPGWEYDFRSCALCGEGLGTV